MFGLNATEISRQKTNYCTLVIGRYEENVFQKAMFHFVV